MTRRHTNMHTQQSEQLAVLQSGQPGESSLNQQYQIQQLQGQVFYPGELDETESVCARSQVSVGARSLTRSLTSHSLTSHSQVEQQPVQSLFARSSSSMSSLLSQTISSASTKARGAVSAWAELDNKRDLLTTHDIVAKLQEKKNFDVRQEARKQEYMRQVVHDALGGSVRETEQLPTGTTLSLQKSLIGPDPRDRTELAPMAKIRNKPRLYELQNMLRSHAPVLSPVSKADSRVSSRHGSKAMSVISELTSVSRQWRPEPLSEVNDWSESKPSSASRSATTRSSRRPTGKDLGVGRAAMDVSTWSGVKRWNEKDPAVLKRCATTQSLYRVV